MRNEDSVFYHPSSRTLNGATGRQAERQIIEGRQEKKANHCLIFLWAQLNHSTNVFFMPNPETDNINCWCTEYAPLHSWKNECKGLQVLAVEFGGDRELSVFKLHMIALSVLLCFFQWTLCSRFTHTDSCKFQFIHSNHVMEILYFSILLLRDTEIIFNTVMLETNNAVNLLLPVSLRLHLRVSLEFTSGFLNSTLLAFESE